ncbi:MAG: CDP-glucose 4,6-dehydratase, partial [Clostridia bacterium]|nr:CDP-glucose 4,6-dehydratase [Clostridia bacterium]
TLALRQAENIGLASAYNIGPADGNATSTIELAKMFFSAWGEEAKIACEEGRHKEAQNLTISSDKIKNALGIAPKLSIQQAVDFTVDWYKAYYHNGDARRLATIQTENYIGL